MFNLAPVVRPITLTVIMQSVDGGIVSIPTTKLMNVTTGVAPHPDASADEMIGAMPIGKVSPNPRGTTIVSGYGFRTVIVIVDVSPTEIVLGEKDLVISGSPGPTVSVSDALPPGRLRPVIPVSNPLPTFTVFNLAPAVRPITLTVTIQSVDGGIVSTPVAKLVAVTTGVALHPDASADEAIGATPLGKVSPKPVGTTIVSGYGFRTVIVMVDAPPKGIVLGEKDLVIGGSPGPTVSVSDALPPATETTPTNPLPTVTVFVFVPAVRPITLTVIVHVVDGGIVSTPVAKLVTVTTGIAPHPDASADEAIGTTPLGKVSPKPVGTTSERVFGFWMVIVMVDEPPKGIVFGEKDFVTAGGNSIANCGEASANAQAVVTSAVRKLDPRIVIPSDAEPI